MFILIIIHSLIIGTFIALGIIFKRGKGLFLIAGYNTASKDKRRKINEKSLLSFMGSTMFLLAGSFVFLLISDVFTSTVLLAVGLVLFFLIVLFSIIYISISKRFRNDSDESNS